MEEKRETNRKENGTKEREKWNVCGIGVET